MLVVASAVLWSTGGVGVKVANAEPLVVAGLRSAFALAFMAGVLLVELRRSGRGLADVLLLVRRPMLWGAAASYALMVVMFVLAARRTTAANAIFIQYAATIHVALLSGPVLGERPTASDLMAVLCSLVGMVLAFGGELGGGRIEGNVLALISSFGFAGLPLFLRVEERRRPSPIAPLVAICLGNALAALVALPRVLAAPPGDARTWLVLLLLGTLQIGLPYVLYGIAVRRLRALEISLLATIEPVLGPLWVLAATGERPSLLALVGGALILLAVSARAIGARRPARRPTVL
jgi:drug/metabolite transporter (DMT)-like permease